MAEMLSGGDMLIRALQRNARSSVIVCSRGPRCIMRRFGSMSKLRSSLRNARAHQRPRAGSDGPAAMSNGVGKLWAILVDRHTP